MQRLPRPQDGGFAATGSATWSTIAHTDGAYIL